MSVKIFSFSYVFFSTHYNTVLSVDVLCISLNQFLRSINLF